MAKNGLLNNTVLGVNMLVLMFKIWCSCLLVTIPCIIVNDFANYTAKPNGLFGMFVKLILVAFVAVDVVLVFVMMLMAIWS